MSDTVFFDTILPSNGLRCVAVPKRNGGYRHNWGPDNAWLAAEVARLSTAGNVDVYYGCSSYLSQAQDRARDASTNKLIIGGRKQTNVAFVRSFWVDLDVGPPEPGKPDKYLTQREAARAILAFADAMGMPKPWLVNSGWGVHAYWPMDRDMTPGEWKPLAEALKRALRAFGILFDPSRTADAASVLRPPGTLNRKHDPRDVTLVLVGGVWTLPEMTTAMTPYVAPAGAPIATAQLGAVPAHVAKLTANNAALSAGAAPDPSSAIMIADRCAVVGLVRDTRGDVDEPTWYNVLGVLGHTIEAPAIAHDWSKGHAEYSVADTNTKLAQLASHGPTTCAKLHDHQPKLCDACPHWGTWVKGPIQLGRKQRTDPGQAAAAAGGGGRKGGAFGGSTAPGLPPEGPEMPYGYGFRMEGGRKVLTHLIPAEDDKPEQWIVFCETFFVPMFNYEVDGVHHNDWLADTLSGDQREFTLDGSTIGTGGRDVAASLGKNGIIALPGKGRVMDGYLNRWMGQLTRTMPLVKAYKSFGWTGDVFVTAGLTLHPDGEENPVVLANPAKARKDAVATKGDLATWVKLVDRAYNAPGQEAYQFQLAAGFASPLLVMMDQVRGVTVYAHSSGSGVGKSTVQKVALSAWGNWEDMMLAQGKVTGNALWGFLGAYNTLPVMFDELTNAPNAEVSDLVFSVSSGRAKERMNAAGELRTNNANWSLILLANGNSLLSDKLSQHRSNAEAEMSRMFEFTLEAAPHLSVLEANALFPKFSDNYGHAGLVYARYLATHREQVSSMLRRMQKRVVQMFEMEQVDRHWAALFASVLVAMHLCRHLKLWTFEVEPVEAWMAAKLAENRGQKEALVQSEEEKLGQMLRDLWPDVLVTIGRGDRRGNPASIPLDSQKPHGALRGRMVQGGASGPDQLWLSRPAIRKWAIDTGANYKELRQSAVAMGWADPKDDHRFDLGVGTAFSTNAYVLCWRLFPDKMPLAVPSNAGPTVVPINQGLTGQAKP